MKATTHKKQGTRKKPNTQKKPGVDQISRKRQRLTQEDRLAQLLDCAVKVFAERGMDAANHALIAEEAGVSVPTVFFYFATREKLVDAVVSEVERVHVLHFENAAKSTKPVDEVLDELGLALPGIMTNHRYLSRIFLEWSIMSRDDTWQRFLKLHGLIIDTLTKLVERGQKEGTCHLGLIPEDEAYILHATAYSITQMEMTGRSPEKIQSYVNSVLNTVLIRKD